MVGHTAHRERPASATRGEPRDQNGEHEHDDKNGQRRRGNRRSPNREKRRVQNAGDSCRWVSDFQLRSYVENVQVKSPDLVCRSRRRAPAVLWDNLCIRRIGDVVRRCDLNAVFIECIEYSRMEPVQNANSLLDKHFGDQCQEIHQAPDEQYEMVWPNQWESAEARCGMLVSSRSIGFTGRFSQHRKHTRYIEIWHRQTIP